MVTNISIIQDNKVSGSDLLPVHSNLAFIVQCDYTGDTPETIAVILKDSGGVALETFKGVPYLDGANYRQFYFNADTILRSFMPDFVDFTQSSGSLIFCDYLTSIFTLTFTVDSISVDITFTAINAAKQFGQNPNCNDLFANESKHFIGAKNKPVYVYFYNNDINNVLTISVV